MKSRQNIAFLGSLLLWVALLCACGYIKAEQLQNAAHGNSFGKSIEQLTGEVAGDSIAWLEQSVPPRAAAAADHALPLLLLVYPLLVYSFRSAGPKPAKAKFGFASLSEQFRILPNAP